MSSLNKKKGQGLVEYLILVCLISVSTIAVVSVVGQNIKARYANLSSALHGKKGTHNLEDVKDGQIQRRGFDDFMESAIPSGGEGEW